MKPPPSPDKIREAIQRLKDPEDRLIDEFFWFWPFELGRTTSDPALDALASRNPDAALKIWTANETNPNKGVVAMHNIALFWQLRALDLESDNASSEADHAYEETVENYWRSSLKRWKYLISDNLIWDRVATRVRQIDDPSLTSGFVRRMRSTLPLALAKINAELALAHAEKGETALAEMHIQFLRQGNHGLVTLDKPAHLVLAPVRARLAQYVAQATEGAKQNPARGNEAARSLIEQTRHPLDLFALFFGRDSDAHNELSDEVARACNRFVIACDNADGDPDESHVVLKAAYQLAASDDLKRLLEQNICWFVLRGIQNSQKDPPSRLEHFTRDAVQALNVAEARLTPGSEDLTKLFDFAARTLRGISLAAWNKCADRDTALAANRLAQEYARGAELKQELLKDLTTLSFEALSLVPPACDNLEILRAHKGWFVAAAILGIIVLTKMLVPNEPSNSAQNGQSTSLAGLPTWEDTLEVSNSTQKGHSTSLAEAPAPSPSDSTPRFSADSFDEPTNGPVVAFPPLNLQGLTFNGAKSFAIINGFTVGIGEHIGLAGTLAQVRVVAVDRDRVTVELDGQTKVLVLGINAPTYTPPPASVSGNSDGKVYRVPSSVSSTLVSEKAEIETERATIEAFEAQIEELGREIERDRPYLDRTSQYAVDAFNAKVDRYNTLNQKAKMANAAFNEKVDNYNAKLQQYGQ
jgi:hypothetical protein